MTTPSFEYLTLEIDQGLAWLTLNRPQKMNAVTGEMRQELVDAFDYFRATPEVRVVVVTGAGRGFCAGADISGRNFPYPREGDPESRLDGRASDLRWGWYRVLKMMWECEKPIIAAVNGAAYGFGSHLAMYADLSIASEEAQFGEVWAMRGLPVEAGGAYMLPRLAGLNRAKEILFFGEPISAQRAYELGLVNRVVPADQLMTAAREWAEKLLQSPTKVLGLIKRQVQMSLD